MRAKRDARALVQELRRQGLSYREILQQVPMSKNSVSLWCRTVELDGAKQQVLRQRYLDAAKNGLMKIAQLRETGQLVRKPLPPPSDNPDEVEMVRRLYWDEQLGFREVAARMGTGPWRIYGLMRRHGIPRPSG